MHKNLQTGAERMILTIVVKQLQQQVVYGWLEYNSKVNENTCTRNENTYKVRKN